MRRSLESESDRIRLACGKVCDITSKLAVPFRRVHLPTIGKAISAVMAHPSSADPETHLRGLDVYRAMGGNSVHLHGEGGETHTREATGRWLRDRKTRSEFFLCTQICHDEWEEAAGRSINRFTAASVAEDIACDLGLLAVDHLDCVYLDDKPGLPVEPVVEALAREIASSRIGGYALRNVSCTRLREACAFAKAARLPGPVAMLTTELALAESTQPLWPEYVPFDEALETIIRELNLPIFAHAEDINLGTFLFDSSGGPRGWRSSWIERWQHPNNEKIVIASRQIAARLGIAARDMSLAWMLNQPFPVVAIMSLPALLDRQDEIQRVARIELSGGDIVAMKSLLFRLASSS